MDHQVDTTVGVQIQMTPRISERATEQPHWAEGTIERKTRRHFKGQTRLIGTVQGFDLFLLEPRETISILQAKSKGTVK